MKPFCLLHNNKFNTDELLKNFYNVGYKKINIDEVMKQKFNVDIELFKKHSKYVHYLSEMLKSLDGKFMLILNMSNNNLTQILDVLQAQNWYMVYICATIEILSTTNYNILQNDDTINENNKLANIAILYNMQIYNYTNKYDNYQIFCIIKSHLIND